MARAKQEYVETNPLSEVVDLEAAHAPALQAEQELAFIKGAYTGERDLINKMLGRIEMSNAISKLTTVVTLSHLAQIKEGKLYRALAGKKGLDPDGNEISDVGTFEGFCQMLGMSYQKVHEDLQNLSAFGEDALKQLSEAGAGYRELRKLRKLPVDVREQLVQGQLVDMSDKDEIVSLIDDMAVKHAKEKESLAKRADDAESDLEASRQRVAHKESENEKLTSEVLKLKRRVETQSPDEAAADIRKEADLFGFRAEHAIRGELAPAFRKLAEHTAEHGGNHEEYMLGLIAQVERAANELRAEFGLLKAGPDGDATPYWMRDDLMEKARADLKAQTPDWMIKEG